MTVGEKIQYYRKKCGFSQEELGQQLLVSRQTISLWEMDRTLPTIDNLIRLKEIFGVSVDELLNLASAPVDAQLSAEVIADMSVENSLQDVADKTSESRAPKKKMGTWGTIFFVFSIISPFWAFATLGIAAQKTDFPEGYYWIFFLYVLIPVASIVYGGIVKKKGRGGKKNIICGSIMAGIICCLGLLFLAIWLTYTHSEYLLIKAEESIGIDIPEYRSILSEDDAYDDEGWGKTALSRCTVFFDEEKVTAFEQEIAADDRWSTTVATCLIGVMPSDYSADCEYFLIYNVETKEINALPKYSGEYCFIGLFYDVEDDIMKIVEYSVEYVA